MFSKRVFLVALSFLPVLIFWRSLVPFNIFGYWFWHGTFPQVLASSWPIFAWGIPAFIIMISKLGPTPIYRIGLDRYTGQQLLIVDNEGFARIVLPGEEPSPMLGLGQILWLGIGEEIIYRWMTLPVIIVLLSALNFLLSGLLAWLYLHILGPIIDFVTFGSLHSILFHNGWGWLVGMAVILVSGNALPRVYGRLYASWLVFWPVKLYLFLLMFQYGLFVAMLVHMLFEFLLFLISSFNSGYIQFRVSGLRPTKLV
ncbi:hypothetical protein EPA93_24305 [Ktedonosporobacter rubrisoli]|uniref:Uncharacterized protein n=2 Tax=Ktedonosporobacter rubrisoli TaxID=2509675 RepID=A0A4P6JUC5_KTERU|nr:hypothetical protein EPA93_24305 [Ktedonosporobacter rubrisoli]